MVNMNEKVSLWTKDFILVCIAQLAISVSFMSVATILPIFLENHLKLTGLMLGVVVASYTVTTIFVRPFIGYLIDHLGRRIIYLPSYCLFGVLFFFYPFVGTIAGMISLRLAHGIFWGANLAGAGTVVVDIIPAQRRGEGLGFFGLTASIGMALGPALGVMIISNFSYTALFIGCAFLLLLFFSFTLTLRIPPVTKSKKKFTLTGLIEKNSLPMGLVMMIMTVSYGGLTTYTAKYVASGEIQASAGLFFVCLALGMAVCRILAGKSFDRSGPTRVMGYCFIFSFAGYLLLALTNGALPFYSSAFILGLGYGIAFPVCSAMVNHLVGPDRRGVANATFWTLFDVGICAGIVLVGFAQERFGWFITHMGQGLFLLLAVGLFWLYSLPHYFNTLHARPVEMRSIEERRI